MLKLAKLHEQELQRLAGTILIDDKYKYFNCAYLNLPEPKFDEWNECMFVSYTDKVIGYMNANVSRVNNIITNIAIFSDAKTYNEYKVFEKDLFEFFLYLLKRFSTIQFSVIVNNPVRKKYRKFIEVIGGNVVGTFHKSVRIQNELLDEEYYEVFSSKEKIEHIKNLSDRIKIKED